MLEMGSICAARKNWSRRLKTKITKRTWERVKSCQVNNAQFSVRPLTGKLTARDAIAILIPVSKLV